MNEDELQGSMSVDPRWVVRNSCVRVGQLPDLKKDDVCWVWFVAEWRTCIVKGKVPGRCFRAKLAPTVAGCREIVICSNNFGGLFR